MRKFTSMLLLLASICAATPALAASRELQSAWQYFNAYVSMEKYPEAETWGKKAIELTRAEYGADSIAYAHDLYNLAELHTRQGRYAEAVPLFQSALEISEKARGPDDLEVEASLVGFANLYRLEGLYSQAIPFDKRALAIIEKARGPDHPQVQRALLTLADDYRGLGLYSDAVTFNTRALEIREKVYGPDNFAVAAPLLALAEVYQRQGRYAEAEPLLYRALRINENARYPDGKAIAATFEGLATLYELEGRYAEAEAFFQRALAIQEKAPDDKLNFAASLMNLAALYNQQGRAAEAAQLGKRSQEITETVLGPEHPKAGVSLMVLGDIYRNLGRYTEAEAADKRSLTILEKALGPDHPNVSASVTNLAKLYGDQGRYAEAETLDRRAMAAFDKLFGAGLGSVGILQQLASFDSRQSQYAKALPLIRQAASITASRATKTQSKFGQSELRARRDIFLDEASITAHLIAANDPQSAQLREEGFTALQWSQASDTAAAVSHVAARFAAGSDALAAIVRERQDRQDRLDAVEAAILNSVSQPPDKRDAAAEAALRTDAESLTRSLKQSDDELAAKFPAYTELASPRPISVAETQALLAPDQALVVIALGKNESYVAVVGHTAAEFNAVPVGGDDVSTAVKALRNTLDPEGKATLPAFEAGIAYKLYRQLLAPAAASLKGVTQLYVVTDGALGSLPLGVLLTDKPAADKLATPEEFRAATWLAKRYAMSVLPSVSSLKALRQFAGKASAPQAFLGVGDPLLDDHPKSETHGVEVASVYRGASVDVAEIRALPSLPETAKELETEANIFKAAQDSLLLREAATVTAVKHADLASRRIIAFATHGLLAGDVGVAEPGLVLTPPAQPMAEDDGLLKASEIAQLKLNGDMVILSACNTAATDGTPGAEGLSGLSKAFLYAGARSVMVSHWSVVSLSTVTLMTQMAKHLEDKDVGRAEALRRAELALMDDREHPEFAHPLFWAPFVLVGEGY